MNLVKSLKITYNGHDGESYSPSLRWALSDFSQKQGDLNFLAFQFENKEYKFEFYLQNWNQELILFKLIRSFEAKGIFFVFKNVYGRNNIYKKYT